LLSVVYLDNSSTTKPCNLAVEYMNNALINSWGNPSSLHTMGINAELELNTCREAISKVLQCRDDEVFFTSGGTEANNIAIMGGVKSRSRRGNRIVTTTIEHPSVLNCFKELEHNGFEVIYLHPQKNGVISENDIYEAINQNTIFVSIMLVNNEIGSIQPLSTAAKAIKENNSPALLHCDAVQAFGKLPIDVKKLGVDLLSLSGHKIHGPKGVGVLFKSKSVSLPSINYGGGQEKGIRSGTECVPCIAGLRGAVESLPNIGNQFAKQKELFEYAKKLLEDTGIVKINSPDDVLPYILNISVTGYRSETLLHWLEAKEIFVSSGSACAKGELSYVLKEIGLVSREIDSSLRISFCKENTKSDIDAFVKEIINATKILKRS